MHRPHAADNANSDRTSTLSDSSEHCDTEADRNTAKSFDSSNEHASTNHTKALSLTSPLPRSSSTLVHVSTLQDSSDHSALSITMSASSMSPSPTLSQASPSSMATASNEVLRTLSMSSANGHGSSSGTTATSVSSSSTLMIATHSSTLIHHGSGSMVTAAIPTGASDVKLKRVLEHNQRLKEQLNMGRISVSEASQRYGHTQSAVVFFFLPLFLSPIAFLGREKNKVR